MNTIQKMSLAVIFIIVSITTFASLDIANGIDKPTKPSLGTINHPDALKFFDDLYNKYPDITQEDVDFTFHGLVKYLDHGKESNAGKVIASGLLKDYLTDLNIPTYSSENKKISPIIIQ